MYLAQFNVAQMRFPFTDPRFDDFKAQLKEVHEIGARHPGFVWRYEGEREQLGYIRPYKDLDLIMGNLSIWKDCDSLFDFTFSGAHGQLMRDRGKWFTKMPEHHSVLWWIPSNISNIMEARVRLSILRCEGPSNLAFTFKEKFEAPA